MINWLKSFTKAVTATAKKSIQAEHWNAGWKLIQLIFPFQVRRSSIMIAAAMARKKAANAPGKLLRHGRTRSRVVKSGFALHECMLKSARQVVLLSRTSVLTITAAMSTSWEVYRCHLQSGRTLLRSCTWAKAWRRSLQVRSMINYIVSKVVIGDASQVCSVLWRRVVKSFIVWKNGTMSIQVAPITLSTLKLV